MPFKKLKDVYVLDSDTGMPVKCEVTYSDAKEIVYVWPRGSVGSKVMSCGRVRLNQGLVFSSLREFYKYHVQKQEAEIKSLSHKLRVAEALLKSHELYLKNTRRL